MSNGLSVYDRVDYYPERWQEVTEAEYLAQEGVKPIVEYHAALEAIGDSDRIKQIPDNLLDAIYNDLAEEKRRRWAISNGWVKQND